MRRDSQALAFSPDGKLLAAAEALTTGHRSPLRVWDVRRRRSPPSAAETTANLIAFSPDGKLIAAAATERGTDIRDARTGRLVKRIGVGDLAGQGDFSRSVAFSPDGDLLFVGQYNGTGRLFSTETWKPVGRPLEAHTAASPSRSSRPTAARLSPPPRTGPWCSGTWRPRSRSERRSSSSRTRGRSAALSPDGSRLYAISTRGEGISFDMSPEAWKRHACLVAGRELTAAEWEEALPGRPYQSVCSGD